MKMIFLYFIFTILFNLSKLDNFSPPEDNQEHQAPDLDILKLNVEEKKLKLNNDLKGVLSKIETVIDMTMSAVDEQKLRTAWREGISIERDLDFEKDITTLRIKENADKPCKAIDFVFNIKSDFEVYEYNCKKYLLCFLKYYDQEIKEYLSDLVLEGINNILKSGFSNPISTFFSNVLIIEGPLKLKNELFGSLYKYVDDTAELNQTYQGLIDTLIYITFDKQQYEDDIQNFLKNKGTPLTFYFYESLIIYTENNDVYLSAYDFIQPDSQMINNYKSMDPVFISNHFKTALEKDLVNFKRIRDNYQITGTSTVYHKAYYNYVKKNIKILCKFLMKTPDC